MMSLAEIESDSEVSYMTATENGEEDHKTNPGSAIGAFFRSRSPNIQQDHGDTIESQHLLAEEDEDEFGEDETTTGTSFTVEQAVESMGYGKFQIKIFFICGLFSATDALEMLLLSVLSPVLGCDWHLSQTQKAFITTAVFIGMFAGSNMWGSWADKFGRLPILMISSIWILYFGILTTFSPNYYWMLMLRGLVGAGFGGAVQSFTLMSEYLPSKHRAKILIIYNFMWAVGSIFEVGMAAILIPTVGWRPLVAMSAMPMFITTFCIWTLPESARFLVAAGKKEKAMAVLKKAAETNGKMLPAGRLVESKKSPRGRFRDLFTSEYCRTTLQLWCLWFGAASSYYGIVLAQSEILELGGTCGPSKRTAESCDCSVLSSSDYWSMIFATFGEFVSIPFNLLTIDTLGRKWTIAINYIAAGIFFLLIQICSKKWVLTIFVFGVRAFTAGIFNATYIYTTEVYPTTVRSLALGSCSALARVGAMITPFVAQVMMAWSLRVSLGVYGAMCIICCILAMTLPYETKGREMPQTQQR